MSEQAFNLDRKINMEENIDPQGKKWEIKKVNKASAMYLAVPNPFHANFVCPKDFAGAWTQPSVLQGKITTWLNSQWDKAERVQKRSGIVAHQAAMAENPDLNTDTKITPEESIAALDPEVAKMVEDINNVSTSNEEKEEVKETEEGSGGSTEADSSGRDRSPPKESTSSPKEKASKKESKKVTKKKVAKKGK